MCRWPFIAPPTSGQSHRRNLRTRKPSALIGCSTVLDMKQAKIPDTVQSKMCYMFCRRFTIAFYTTIFHCSQYYGYRPFFVA